MDIRRLDEPIRISPAQDFEPSAPSPDSIAASPMISARMSDCAEMPLESDDGDACSYASRRSTLSSRMDSITDLTKDNEFQKKYPEAHAYIVTNTRGSNGGFEVPSGLLRETKEERLADEIRNLYSENRDVKRSLRREKRQTDKLVEENKKLREEYGQNYVKTEQEEEFISNTLLKRMHQMKNEKELLTQRYENEIATTTMDMKKTICTLQQDKAMLEDKLKKDHSSFVEELYKRIRVMEQELDGQRNNIDRLRMDKIDQENALENEQELLFNTLGKQMDQLNSDKRNLQASLEKAYSNGFVDPQLDPTALNPPPLVFKEQTHNCNGEVMRLRSQLKRAENQIAELKDKDASKEAKIRCLEENNKHLKWFKDHYKQIRTVFDSEMPPEMPLETPHSIHRAEVNMGPPSVPPTPRSIDNSSDMDETASYPASVDMN